jgi:signal peptidase I
MAASATVPFPTDLDTGASTVPDPSVGAVSAWCGLVGFALARAYRAFLLTLLATAMVPLLWSWGSYVVRSGSMEPSLSVGDVVVAKPFASDSWVPVGRVMLFTPPTAVEGHETRIHRVVENLGHGSYTTAGDANRSDDAEPVPAENFHAQAVICVPFVALPLTWWYERDLIPLILVLVLTPFALYFSWRPSSRPRRRRRKERNRARRVADKAAGLLRHRVVAVAAVLTAMAAATAGLTAGADAAFTATTPNRSNTWTVSATLAQRVSLASPGAAVHGTVPLTAALSNTGAIAYSVRMEYTRHGTTAWTAICTDSSAPYTCDWLTAGFANGGYDLRAVAVSATTTLTSAVVANTLVDNLAPSVAMQDPGSPLGGTVTFAATATDTLSGIAGVVIQYALAGSTTYKNLCSIAAGPYSCVFDTATLPGGTYSFRAVATDAAGNTSVSVVVTNRVVDNTVTSIVMNDPGAILSGNVTLTAAASSTAGVASVRIQGSPAGTASWTDVCLDSSSPYSCGYNTTAAPDGLYDLRAIVTDGVGRSTTSAVLANRRVDNTAPYGYDVQTTNGGTAGKLDSGDTISLTYDEQMKPGTVTPGWDGTALAVTVRLRDGGLLGLGAKGDSVDILRAGAAINLGSVNLREDYISSNLTAQFAATMTASTTTVNGVSATRITIVVGVQTSGTTVRTATVNSTMTWGPSTLTTDLAGLATVATAVSESGVADRQF